MLDILTEVEKDLPKLLMADGWKSLYIDYHLPVVERMFRRWDRDPSIRISLHWAHSCDRYVSLYHRHPWPSAFKLLTGACWMKVGGGVDQVTVSEILLRAPSAYEMTNKEGWHSVSPIDEVDPPEMSEYRRSSGGVLSIMVSGSPWGGHTIKPTKKLHSLSESQQLNLLDRFRYWYPHRFIDFVRRKEVFCSTIDNFIGRWHDGETGVEQLHDFLGFTQEEYARWVEEDSSLMGILVKKTLEFEQRLGTCEGFPLE